MGRNFLLCSRKVEFFQHYCFFNIFVSRRDTISMFNNSLLTFLMCSDKNVVYCMSTTIVKTLFNEFQWRSIKNLLILDISSWCKLPATLLKKKLQHRCLSCEICKTFKNTYREKASSNKTPALTKKYEYGHLGRWYIKSKKVLIQKILFFQKKNKLVTGKTPFLR